MVAAETARVAGTVAGANTTRYHTLLLTGRKPPSERFVFVNHLEHVNT